MYYNEQYIEFSLAIDKSFNILLVFLIYYALLFKLSIFLQQLFFIHNIIFLIITKCKFQLSIKITD